MRVTVRQTQTDRWQVRCRSGATERARSFSSEEEARQAASEMNALFELEEAGFKPAPILLDAIEEWLTLESPRMKPSTVRAYRASIRNHIVGTKLSRTRISLIRPKDLAGFVSEAKASGATLMKALRVVQRAVSYQIENGLEVSPLKVGKLVRLAPREVEAWTPREVSTILDLCSKHDQGLYPLLRLLADTGMRRGEAMGLKWSDIDYPNAEIRVRRSLTEGRIGTPKNGKGRRVVMVPELQAVLRGISQQHHREWVFEGPRGGRIGDAWVSRHWQRLSRLFAENAVRDLTLHSFRHSWISHALEAGESVRWVADQAGHSSPTLTLTVYAHAMPREAKDLDWLKREAF